MIKRKISRRMALALATVSSGVAARAFAATTPTPNPYAVTWIGTGAADDYTAGVNWTAFDPAYTAPYNRTATDKANNVANPFLEIANGGTAHVDGVTGTNAQGAFLNLGMQPTESGNLVVSGGTLTLGELRVGGRETIPDYITGLSTMNGVGTPTGGGSGTVVQTGGAVNVTYQDPEGIEPPVQSTYIGDAGLSSGNTANGSYTISGGTLLSGIATDDAIAIGTGSGATGTFMQSGTSTVTSTGFVVVARAGATAGYTMSSGTLNAGVGTAASTMNLWIGDGASVDGNSAVAGTVGTFTQTGGDVFVKSAVEIGRRTGTGTYTMSAGTVSTGAEFRVGSNGNSSVAALQSGNGTFNLSGTAIVNVGSNLHVGIGGAAVANTVTGVVNMTGGTINMNTTNINPAFIAVGNGQGSNGTFIFSAGTINAGTTTTLDIGRNAGMGLFDQSGSASLNITTLTIDSSTPTVASPREFKLEGGTATIAVINNGTQTPPALVTRKFTMTGGTLNVTTTTAGGKGVTWNLSGGDATFGGLITFDTSVVNLTGTNLIATSLTTGTGQFYYSAGALTASTIFTLSSGGSFKTDNDQTLTGVASFNVGTASVNVNTGTLTIPNRFNDSGRVLTKTGPGALTITGDQFNTILSGASPGITVSTGTLNLNSNAAGPTAVGVPGLLLLVANSATNMGTSQGLASIAVGSGAVATLTENPTPTTTNKVINTTAVGAISGKLDLTNNKLVTASAIGSLSGSTYTGVLGLVQSGRNGGAWNGNGIVTSETSAASPHFLTTLGVATGADVKGISGTTTATWAGQTVSANSTLVMYTYAGDANLDGKINADDYFNIDSNYNKPATATYCHGDFNYDGQINGDDYFIIDSNYVAQSTAFATGSAFDAGLPVGLSAGSAGSLQAVPEPASLATLGIISLSALRRRRRR